MGGFRSRDLKLHEFRSLGPPSWHVSTRSSRITEHPVVVVVVILTIMGKKHQDGGRECE